MGYPTAAYDLLPLYNLAKQGRIFSGNIAAAGVVLPIYSNTTQQVGLWNPAGSSIDVILLRLALTYVSGTGAAGGYVLGYLPNAPASVATGASIAAFTETAAISHYVGTGLASAAKFGQGATITVTAPSVLLSLGLNQTVLTAATTSSPQWSSVFDFTGQIVLTPGTAIFVCGNIATLSTWSGSLTWAEVSRVA